MPLALGRIKALCSFANEAVADTITFGGQITQSSAGWNRPGWK